MLHSFANRQTRRVWYGERTKLHPEVERAALRKLHILHAAETLDDLRSPPGNRLEALHGDRAGQHSIRVNKQHRICFRWTDTGPEDVAIVDYH